MLCFLSCFGGPIIRLYTVALLGGLPPGADLKFTAPRDFCLISQKIFDDLFFGLLYFPLIYGSFVTLPKIFYPSKCFSPFQIFGYNLNFAAPLKVPPGEDRPYRPIPLATPLFV